MNDRILDWDHYALLLANVAAMKSKDPWKKVGCCLLRSDNSIASVGFNGFPAGMEEDWSDRDRRRMFVCHAEQNALRYITPGEASTAASTLLPCNDCLKSLASYGIKKVIYSEVYNRDDSSILLSKCFGITLTQIKSPIISLDGVDFKV